MAMLNNQMVNKNPSVAKLRWGQRGGVLREVDGHRGAAEVHPAGAGAATTTWGKGGEIIW